MKRLITIILLICLLAGSVSGQWIWQQKPILGLQIDWSHPQARGLVGCWLKNEGSGSIVNDSSGNGHSGTITNAFWTPGLTGTALGFDATGDYVDFGAADWTENLSELSVVALVKNNNASKVGIVNRIVDKWIGFNCFLLCWDSTEKFYFSLRTNTAGPVYAVGSIRDGTLWHHVVGTYDGANIRLYVNGILEAGPVAITGTTRSAATNLLISSSAENCSWDGLIDHVYIYNRALSSSEIPQLYREQFCMFEPALPGSMMYDVGGAPPAPTGQVIMISCIIPILTISLLVINRKKAA